jgi:hypothetical protein
MNPGNSFVTGLAYWTGSPINVAITEFNPPAGTLVLDITNNVLYQKTSPLGSNSGYTLIAAAAGGVLAPASVAATGAVTSSSATVLSGYTTGSGGTVTQLTSITTGVTLSKPSGQIVTVSSTAAAGASVSFTVTNTIVAATDAIIANVGAYGGTTGLPIANVTSVGAGSYVVTITNIAATGSLNGTVTVNVNIFNGVVS